MCVSCKPGRLCQLENKALRARGGGEKASGAHLRVTLHNRCRLPPEATAEQQRETEVEADNRER